ncbi:MAG: peroxide stress protein YaaA [Solobacterium sp.]|nr:peroxide stress protein YaaA [Solobacterium sp.]
MKIIISPAKQMKEDDILLPMNEPVFLRDAEKLRDWMRSLNSAALKKLWACSDRILNQNIQRLESMKLQGSTTAALFAYDGIQYKYLAPNAFTQEELDYVQDHLRILSGFYGVLKPMDGVVPYRLEMQARTDLDGRDLYGYWGDRLYREVLDDSRIIVNLASEEYARCIRDHLTPQDTFLTCTFAEEDNGRFISKGVYCKMARGAMVRWMAEHSIEDVRDLQAFRLLDYSYSPACSADTEYVFIRKKESRYEE